MIKIIPFKMKITVKQYSEMCGISVPTARRHLNKLVKEGKVFVNKKHRPYTYQRKSYEVVKYKDGLQRIRVLRDLVIGRLKIKKGTIGGIVQNVEFDHDTDIWIDSLSVVKNSKLKGPTYISKSSISNSTISESDIKLCVIDQSIIQQSRLFNSKVNLSEVGSSFIQESKIHKTYLINNSKLRNSSIRECHHVGYSTVRDSQLLDSSIDHTTLNKCNFKSLSIFDSYIQESSLKLKIPEVRNSTLVSVDVTCDYPTSVKNLRLWHDRRNLSRVDLIRLGFGLGPDETAYYVMYKRVNYNGRYFSVYNPNFEYKIGKYADLDDYDRDHTSVYSKGFYVTNLDNIYDFPGNAVLQVRVHVDDIISVGEDQVRCRRLYVIREV